MTTTVSADCTEIAITSDLFQNDNTALTLIVTKSCGTALDPIDLLDEGIGTGDTYTLTADSLGEDSTTPPISGDGVYHLLLTQTDGDGNLVTESKCVLLDCLLTCDMQEVFNSLNSDPEYIIRALSYHALKVANDSCTSCSCTDWCTLYSTATDTDCDDDSNCGCN